MKIKKCLLCLLLIIVIPINAEEQMIYKVANAVDEGFEIINEFSNLNSARNYYLRHIDKYNNLVLLENDKVLTMEYGIVEFKVQRGCNYNIEYKDAKTKEDRYLNGCYGIDAAYLSSSKDFNTVYFEIASSRGYTSLDNVILHPIDNLNLRVSVYSVKNGSLYHEVKTQLESDFYSHALLINKAPDYLKEDNYYYSYDGHYFYENFKIMIDDMIADRYTNAINSDYPYYNYYQYIPHRTISNYSLVELENYFTNVLFFDKKLDSYFDYNNDSANDEVNRSQYVGELASFIQNQYLYGANAMMMLSLSINESSYGKSSLAYSRNNLFGHAAFDNDVERNASRYLNIATSVYSHAKYYIGDRYSNPERSTYYGSFFGNKESGMNLMYASDPYWGEKAASYYYQLDKSLGFKDLNAYALAIKTNDDELMVYKDIDLENELFRIKNINPYSVVLLEDLDDCYKIQLDASFNEDNHYSFIDSVGYVKKDAFSIILNEEKIISPSYYEVNYDFDGGVVDNQSSIKLMIKDNTTLSLIDPYKKGYEFSNFTYINEDIINNDFIAKYKKINNIELISYPERVVEYNYRLNLKGGLLKVEYDDGTSKNIPLNTNMVSGYDLSVEGIQNVIVSYCGLTTSYEIEVSKKLDQDRINIDENINKIIDRYNNDFSYNQDEVLSIINKINNVKYRLSDDQIRSLDKILLDLYQNEMYFHIKKSRLDANISGMALSLDTDYSLEKKHFLYRDTYYMDLTPVGGPSYNYLKEIGDAYGLEVADSIHISFKRNLKKIKPKLPFIVQLAIKDIDPSKIYTVYRLDDEGDVEKCKTIRTKDYIEFLTSGDGSFMILSKESANNYDFDNHVENLTYDNNGYNLNQIYFELLRNITTVLIDIILVIFYKIKERERIQLWNAYKRSFRNVELHQEEKQKN